MRLLRKGYLQVSKLHKLYFELRGRNGGIPAVFLHGGPGSGFKPHYFESFKKNHCVLFFDQRGAGNSRPKGKLEENTTQHLVDDIAKLMDHVGMKKAKIVGGSWGSTLALCFAIKYPERVSKLVIGGVYLGTKQENDELMRNLELFSPQLFHSSKRKPSFSGKLDAYMVRRLRLLEGSIINNETTWERVKSKPLKKTHWIEPHYLQHDCFLPPDYIMKNVHTIAHIPLVVIQGQQDLVCPPITAWRLSTRFRKKKFVLVPGGHMYSGVGEIYRKNI